MPLLKSQPNRSLLKKRSRSLSLSSYLFASIQRPRKSRVPLSRRRRRSCLTAAAAAPPAPFSPGHRGPTQPTPLRLRFPPAASPLCVRSRRYCPGEAGRRRPDLVVSPSSSFTR
jgi:hypothetical protein